MLLFIKTRQKYINSNMNYKIITLKIKNKSGQFLSVFYKLLTELQDSAFMNQLQETRMLNLPLSKNTLYCYLYRTN